MHPIWRADLCAPRLRSCGCARSGARRRPTIWGGWPPNLSAPPRIAHLMAANPIFVETEEEIPAVIERIKSTEASEVPLVLPARSRFGQSRFNFQLLRDYAVRLGKRVAIISADPAVQRMAQESGFAAYRAVDHYTPFPEAAEPTEAVTPPAPEPPPRLVEVVPGTAEVAPVAPPPDAPAP